MMETILPWPRTPASRLVPPWCVLFWTGAARGHMITVPPAPGGARGGAGSPRQARALGKPTVKRREKILLAVDDDGIRAAPGGAPGEQNRRNVDTGR
jgi:hypothetical protein